MKAIRMVDGEMEADGPLCTVYKATVIFWPPPEGGLFVRKKFFGEVVRAGEAFAIVQDPYTGKEVGRLVSPEEGIVIPSGQNWPAVPI